MADSVRGESSSNSDASNSTSKWKYHVFLSFAGEDTRLKFVGHLDEAFKRSGIKTFKDDADLERGGDIKKDLFQAIEDSLCAVVVISENYAKSTWCLKELQKILEAREKLDREVFPIFYDIDPADVRHQRKSFRRALDEHEKKFKENTTEVQNWKNVLSEIASLSGWDTRGKHEADLIKNIVADVWTYLSSKLPSYDGNLVGIESRVGDMMPILEIGMDDARFVGIWGMGGVGKTTLARVVYKKLSDKFEGCCFLANVRETLQREDRVSLQKKLLSNLKIKSMEISDEYTGMEMIRQFLRNKKVLLVLDDLDNMNQLKNLAESPDWFGKGSRIIITTRNKQLLISSGVDEQRIYDMKTMKEDVSLQLFSNKAFNKNSPQENYSELSKSVVKYAGGLPLALEVLGSFLCGRSIAEWRAALDSLKKSPNDNICQVLKMSFNALNGEEKTIFLDIACFFKGWKKKQVTQILESCDLHPTIGIQVLIEKTLLVETKDCRLEMHDLLEGLGRNIVEQESTNDIHERSRLWKFEDVKEVLENNKGSKAIQAIVLQNCYQIRDRIKVHRKAFWKMSNIRLLIFDYNSPLTLPQGLMKFSGSLKVVQWQSCPFKVLPLRLDKLVHIEMHGSKMTQLWNGIQSMGELKLIDLRGSCDFTETPDFSGVPCLEHLCLGDCRSLVKVHHSLGKLEKLAKVDLGGCENLELLPKKLETNSLIKLDLGSCKKVAMLPEFGEGMKKLSYLDVSDTAITGFPESLESLTGLRALNLSNCNNINLDKLLEAHITREVSSWNPMSLTELYLRGCGLSDGSILDDFDSLSTLTVLDLSSNDFVNLPTGCFSGLFRLLFLSLDDCKKLKSLPRLPPRLIRLNAAFCNSMEPLLSDRQLWNLVASLDHEHRARTKYLFSDEQYDDDTSLEFKPLEPECHPLRDFFAVIPGREIPSWFPNKEYCPSDKCRAKCEMKVNIPLYFRDSEWSGIVVCFPFSGSIGWITWSSKAAEDDDYTYKEWGHYCTIQGDHSDHHQCIMVLELNEKTCWRRLKGHDNSLHIKLSTSYHYHVPCCPVKILGCGWKVLCKEEIQEWCNLSHFNQLTHPQHLASADDLKLPKRVFNQNYVEYWGEHPDFCCVM